MNVNIGADIAIGTCFFSHHMYQPLRGIARAKRLNTSMICEKPVSRSQIRLLFFSTFTMTDDVARSVGQGNVYSRVIPHRPSIVTGLHARPLTGRRLYYMYINI
jgi:hypothetical protein